MTHTAAKYTADDVHDNVKRVENLTETELANKPVGSRLILVHQLKERVNQVHPPNPQAPNVPIDETKIPREKQALLKLVHSINYSDYYTALIQTISRKAAVDLAENTAVVKQLLRWNKLSPEQRAGILNDFHKTMMAHAKNECVTCPELSGHFRPVSVGTVTEEPETCPETGASSIRDGYAKMNPRTWPGSDGIAINDHDLSGFQNALEAIETIAHETAHVIEGQLGFMHFHNPDCIPDILKEDAKQNFSRFHYDAYVGSRILSVYFAQANEKIAEIAGNITRNITKQAMDNLTPA